MKYREETDSMGTVKVPYNAFYGAQTLRAINNFPISGLRFPIYFIHNIALIKKCAATVNVSLGLIEKKTAGAIILAAKEIMAGKYDADFIVDVFQTGSGTSTNMNVNEVIATRANEILTGIRNTKTPVHPNDHVNLGQSSNDVIPSAMHICAYSRISKKLIPALASLGNELKIKSDEFKHIKKIARTHLQDAVVISLGDEFSGYARQIELSIQRIETVYIRLSQLALGGTAVGSGLNAAKGFADRVIGTIASETGIAFSETPNHFESQAAMDTAVETSGILKTIAVSLMKIANDIRWLASGPRCGLGEINLTSLQPGSSIMPGKVNPVISEAVIQAAAHVIGNDAAITTGGAGSYFELNTMIPLIAYNLFQSIDLLTNAAGVFAEKCITGITANPGQCASNVKNSLAIVTGLIPHIGYDRAAALAQKAYDTGRTIEQVAIKEQLLPKDDLLRVLYYKGE